MSDKDEKALVAQILSSYLANNSVAAADLPSVIDSVKRAFGATSTETDASSPTEAVKTWEPAVPVKRSVTPDAVTCLCCGASFKSLKRHLQKAHNLDPIDYREAFHLKADYPLVAPNYALKRSELAKSLGLGRKPKAQMVEAPKKRGPKPKIARAAAA